VGEQGRITIPVRVLQAAKLGVDDYATFEVLPSVDLSLEGEQATSHEFEVKQRLAEAKEIGDNTFNAYLPMWMKNFRANLDLIPKDAFSLKAVKDVEKGRKAIVVGGGPSLKEKTDWDSLRTFDGAILATNKALAPLLKEGVVPTMVLTLDGLPEVMKSFEDPIVEQYREKIDYLGPTVTDPAVTKFVLSWAKKCVWGNPHMPSSEESSAWNLNLILELFNGLELLRHGGNVGTMGWLVAKHLGCNPIALIGFDMCFHPDPSWTREQAIGYEYYYSPLNNEMMALDSAFKAYLSILSDVTDMGWQEGVATVNMTPVGALNSSRLYPNITLTDYISKDAPRIIEESKKERDEGIALMMKLIQDIRDAAKPIFRQDL